MAHDQWLGELSNVKKSLCNAKHSSDASPWSMFFLPAVVGTSKWIQTAAARDHSQGRFPVVSRHHIFNDDADWDSNKLLASWTKSRKQHSCLELFRAVLNVSRPTSCKRGLWYTDIYFFELEKKRSWTVKHVHRCSTSFGQNILWISANSAMGTSSS